MCWSFRSRKFWARRSKISSQTIGRRKWLRRSSTNGSITLCRQFISCPRRSTLIIKWKFVRTLRLTMGASNRKNQRILLRTRKALDDLMNDFYFLKNNQTLSISYAITPPIPLLPVSSDPNPVSNKQTQNSSQNKRPKPPKPNTHQYNCTILRILLGEWAAY